MFLKAGKEVPHEIFSILIDDPIETQNLRDLLRTDNEWPPMSESQIEDGITVCLTTIAEENLTNSQDDSEIIETRGEELEDE